MVELDHVCRESEVQLRKKRLGQQDRVNKKELTDKKQDVIRKSSEKVVELISLMSLTILFLLCSLLPGHSM